MRCCCRRSGGLPARTRADTAQGLAPRPRPEDFCRRTRSDTRDRRLWCGRLEARSDETPWVRHPRVRRGRSEVSKPRPDLPERCRSSARSEDRPISSARDRRDRRVRWPEGSLTPASDPKVPTARPTPPQCADRGPRQHYTALPRALPREVLQRRRAAGRTPVLGTPTRATPRRGHAGLAQGGHSHVARAAAQAQPTPLGSGAACTPDRAASRGLSARPPLPGGARVGGPETTSHVLGTTLRGPCSRGCCALVRFVEQSDVLAPPRWPEMPRDRLALDRTPVARCRCLAAHRSLALRREPDWSPHLRGFAPSTSPNRLGGVTTTEDPVLPWALCSFEGFPAQPLHTEVRDPPPRSRDPEGLLAACAA